MRLTLKKELNDNTVRSLLATNEQDMDEFIITNFQDELDMELFFSGLSKGKFILTEDTKEGEINHKIFYRTDYESFKEKLDFGVYNNIEFVECLKKNCPNLSEKLKFNNKNENARRIIRVLDKETIIRNFRKIYISVEEYSINRIRNERNKVLKK